MGQQQLLLVILVTIIVGIATVVAINTFGSAADSANLDAVRQDMATIASSAQGYYMKPNMLGGGGRTFTGLTFEGMAVPGEIVDATNLTNENGDYEITVAAQSVTIVATPASTAGDASPETITGTITPNGFALAS